jgi:hypothetical protein
MLPVREDATDLPAVNDQEEAISAVQRNRADLMRVGPDRPIPQYIDVSLVNPSAPSHRTISLIQEANVAAKRGEKLKRKRYGNLLSRDWANSSRKFVPFVLEATGRLGQAACDFLQTIVDNEGSCLPEDRADYIAKVGMVCMLAAAKMAVDWSVKVDRAVHGHRGLLDMVSDILN